MKYPLHFHSHTCSATKQNASDPASWSDIRQSAARTAVLCYPFPGTGSRSFLPFRLSGRLPAPPSSGRSHSGTSSRCALCGYPFSEPLLIFQISARSDLRQAFRFSHSPLGYSRSSGPYRASVFLYSPGSLRRSHSGSSRPHNDFLADPICLSQSADRIFPRSDLILPLLPPPIRL